MRLPYSAALSSFALTYHQSYWRCCGLLLKKQQHWASSSAAFCPRKKNTRNRCRSTAVCSQITTTTTSSSSSLSACSLESIAEQYDAFILDQFGVLHNGQTALPGAVEAVQYLYEYPPYDGKDKKKKKKKLMILSNTSAPAAGALERLPKYGFQPEWFAGGGAVTSGEEAIKFFLSQQQQPPQQQKVLFWTWDDRMVDNPRVTAPPQMFFDRVGSHIQMAKSIEDADWLLLHGSEVWNRGPDLPLLRLGTFIEDGTFDNGLEDLLRQCAIRNIPMICANPDEQVVTPTGSIAYMPGGIARRYQEICAELSSSSLSVAVEHYIFGKPDPRHFRACVEALGMTNDLRKVLHVGDSMQHDIIGATNAGIDTLLITSSGIHVKELDIQALGEPATDEKLSALFQRYNNVRPTHVLPAFRLSK